MFTLDQYLDVVPLPVLIAAPIILASLFLICPARFRLPIALVILPPFLLTGRLPMLGAPALGAKALGFAMLLAVGFAAIFTPGPKRQLGKLCYAYVPLALVAPLFLITTEDNAFPLLRSVQWICMIFAVIAVARTVVDSASLMRVLRCLSFGLILDMPILLSSLLSGQWTFTGHSRFEPYGASSSQIGVVFTLATVFSLYFAFRDRNLILKVVYAGTAAASTGMALLSGSRAVVFTMVGACIPIGLAMMRKPILAVPMIGIFVVGVAVVISRVEANPFQRFKTLETARGDQALRYIEESISQRPFTGLLGTRGLSADADTQLGYHTHNAYLMQAYHGGLLLLVPYLLLAGLSLYSAFQVWRHRYLMDVDPLLISSLAALMAMVYAHGFSIHFIYLATNIWGFSHVLLSMLFITWAGEVARFRKEQPAMAMAMMMNRGRFRLA